VIPILLVSSSTSHAADLPSNEITRIEPTGTEYRGLDTTDLDWLCPDTPVADRDIASNGAEQRSDAACSLLRNTARGRISTEISRPVQASPLLELDEDRELSWAETAALSQLDALGLDRSQVGDVTARFVARTSDDDDPHTSYAIGTIVYVDRVIGGVPVVGERATVLFDLDHTLRAVYSTWPTVQVDGSTWTLPASGDCSALGASSWTARVVEPDAVGSVSLSTALVPSADPSHVVLSVLSETLIQGLGGGSKRQIRVCGGGVE